MKILVVDDEEVILKLFKNMLDHFGFKNVLLANGWKQAVEVAEEEDIDLVFLDIVMPEKDGIKVFKLLKNINPKVHIVMMTGYAVDHLIEKAMKMGGLDYLYKPFDIVEIEAVINKIKNRKKLKPLK